MQPSLHRLFLACPVPDDAAQVLVGWANSALDNDSVKFSQASDLHVTLAFYPAVSDAERERLISLTRQVTWEPLHVEVGKLVPRGRSALALDLIASEEAKRMLDTRLVLASCPSSDALLNRRLHEEPLGKLSLAQGEAEWERRRRRHRHGQPLGLHVTLARTRRGIAMDTSQLHPPKLKFTLDRVALFESKLSHTGSQYTLLSESM